MQRESGLITHCSTIKAWLALAATGQDHARPVPHLSTNWLAIVKASCSDIESNRLNTLLSCVGCQACCT